MSKMKKVLALLLIVVLTVSLGACKSSKKEEPKADVTTEDGEPAGEEVSESDGEYEFTEPVTIKFANYAVLEAGYDKFWEDVKKGFEEKYPNIKIEYMTAEYGQMLTQVVTWAGGGEIVDLVLGEIPWIPTLADAGLAVPVTDAFSEDYLSQIYPSMLEATNVDGVPYGIPMYASPFVMFYNKDLFEQAGLDPNAPPTTVAEMMEVAPKLAALKTADGNPVYPFGMTTGSVSVSGSCLTSLIYGFGGSVLDADGNLDVDNDGFKQTFEFIKELDDKGYNPQVSKLKDLRNLFALGQLGMYYDTSWGFNGVNSINSTAKEFIASAAPLSGGAGKGESLIQAHTFMMANNGEAQVEATKLLIKYILTEKVLAPYLQNVAPGYPSMSALSEIPAITESPVLSGALSSLNTAKGIANIPAINDFNIELTSLAQAVTVDNKDIDTAINDFKTSAGSILGN
ncbi:multiple sugar transport system substrate-binding protein [Mobilisporobacter senegalensis]|uniref:Multiple sugar transport system substrate-binding protein n=1 Tax=Mobilisporobacter senegalensis TaxID=1329262 RepID=A0A3N1XEZ2_9FIRM|nr:extracellular solute-binding protein [Mobilisporobacter senegalensis]ROR25289.1 multiple sugar transport system substrate-binding protein [Mobilisporobacter senegalensis]